MLQDDHDLREDERGDHHLGKAAEGDVVQAAGEIAVFEAEEFAALVRHIRKHTPNIHKAVLSVHCHDDLGLATANTLAAVQVFRDLGATVTEVKTGWGPEVMAACMAYLTHIFGGYISGLLDDHADQVERSEHDEQRAIADHFGEPADDQRARNAGESSLECGKAYFRNRARQCEFAVGHPP